MIPAGARFPRRIEWAERENARRHRVYGTEVEAWHRRHDELIRLRVEAAGFLGCVQPRTGLPVDLDDDEVVYRVLPAVELVEAKARHVVGLPTPGLTVAAASVGAPARALRGGLQVVDAGMAVVTNHRVAFAGRVSRREWTYADMVGLAHHPDVPLTLLHTTDGRRLAGLLVPAAITVNFRFYLTLAFAAAIGRRAAVIAQIDALLDAHRRARPVPPPLVEADHARRSQRRPDRLVAAAAALVTFAFATLNAGPPKPGQPRLPHPTNPGSSGIAINDAPNSIQAIGPNTPTKPPAANGGTGGSLTGPAATGPRHGARAGDRRIHGTEGVGTAAPSVKATGPAAHSASAARPGPTTAPAPGTMPSPTTGPTPTSAPSSPEPSTVGLCTDPLRLPLVDPLLCSTASN